MNMLMNLRVPYNAANFLTLTVLRRVRCLVVSKKKCRFKNTNSEKAQDEAYECANIIRELQLKKKEGRIR